MAEKITRVSLTREPESSVFVDALGPEGMYVSISRDHATGSLVVYVHVEDTAKVHIDLNILDHAQITAGGELIASNGRIQPPQAVSGRQPLERLMGQVGAFTTCPRCGDESLAFTQEAWLDASTCAAATCTYRRTSSIGD